MNDIGTVAVLLLVITASALLARFFVLGCVDAQRLKLREDYADRRSLWSRDERSTTALLLPISQA